MSTPSYLRRLIQDRQHGHDLRSATTTLCQVADLAQPRLLRSALIAKFHYTDMDMGPDTDTDTDPNGPARTQRSFAAKESVSVSVSGPCSGI